jgi:hypothetical protein
MQRVEQEESGHDFSRAVNATKKCWALAPEGMIVCFLVVNVIWKGKGWYENSL